MVSCPLYLKGISVSRHNQLEFHERLPKFRHLGSTERDTILEGASNFNKRTTGCVKLVERTTEADYIGITGNDTGCWSYVGRLGGRQELNLQRGSPGCVHVGTIEHEMLHALGTWHEQSRPDR